MKDITILVNSCDSYEDCWYPFFTLFEKYWENCPYDMVLNTETKSYFSSKLNVRQFNSPKLKNMAYGGRMFYHLQKIKTPYVLLLLDDFFLRDYVDMPKIEQILSWMKKDKNIAVFSFANVKDPLNIPSEGYVGFDRRPQYGEYKLNLQAALWDREKLIRYTKKHEDPWAFETIGSMRTFETEDAFYVLRDESASPINYGKRPGLTWGIVRGKWCIEDVQPLFEKENLEIDCSIRGAYNGEETAFIPKRTGLSTLKSIGMSLWVKSQIFRIVRKIKMLFGKQVDADYIAYLRRKHIESKIYQV